VGLAVAEARMAGRPHASEEDVRRAARGVARRGLEEHATLLQAPYGWEDLVLTDDVRAVLQSIAAHLRHRSLVLDTWGFGRRVAPGAGLKLLFAGESGTGKTMAAQVIANSLGLDLYRVDLSRTVSKFIGETEKNLARLFDAAEDASAVLLFDEADALFGKRSAVSDAHDRYANLEVAYLLQRIEDFAGVVVLATNLRHNLDQAFLRRLDFAVDFPVPDRAHRRRLWESHFPDEAPLADDLDLDALADHTLSGGSIRNCVLRAAFAAADDGRVISAAHVERALQLEHRKLGRLAVGAGSPE
jgi:SpoVK/Ycf46/Vps4 family AAA+-type ATPase